MRTLRIWIFSTKADLTRKKMTSNLLSRNRKFVSFPVSDFQKTKRQMLTWAASEEAETGAAGGIFCFLDNQGYPESIRPGFECLLAFGAADSLEAPAGQAFSRLKAWTRERREWFFGHFA